MIYLNLLLIIRLKPARKLATLWSKCHQLGLEMNSSLLKCFTLLEFWWEMMKDRSNCSQGILWKFHFICMITQEGFFQLPWKIYQSSPFPRTLTYWKPPFHQTKKKSFSKDSPSAHQFWQFLLLNGMSLTRFQWVWARKSFLALKCVCCAMEQLDTVFPATPLESGNPLTLGWRK